VQQSKMSKALDIGARWAFVLIQVFAIIATFVSFGAELINETESGNAGGNVSWEWNEVVYVLNFGGAQTTIIKKYTDAASADPRTTACLSGGRALVAFAILALLAFCISLPLAILRAVDKEHHAPRIGMDIRRYLNFEFALAIVECIFVFLMTTIFGGTCFHAVQADSDVDGVNAVTVKATGFAFIAVSCAFMFVNLAIFYFLRSTKLSGMGETGSTSSADGESRRAAFASVYNQPGAAPEASSPAAGGEPSAPPAGTGKEGYSTFN